MLPIELGNWIYFLFTIGAFLIVALIGFLGYKIGPVKAKKLLLWVIWGNIALHFLKTPMYVGDFPNSLRHLLPENLCAVSVLAAPFIITLWKNDYALDYLFIMGILGGVFAIIFPTTPLDSREFYLEHGYLQYGEVGYVFDCIRYYVCHILLLATSILMLESKVYTVNYHRAWVTPLVFCFVELFIALVTALASLTGIYGEFTYGWELFTASWAGNPSFQTGLPPDNPVSNLSDLVPFFFKFTFPDGSVGYIAGLYLLFPCYLIFYPMYVLFLMIFDRKRAKEDITYYKNRIKAAWANISKKE